MNGKGTTEKDAKAAGAVGVTAVKDGVETGTKGRTAPEHVATRKPEAKQSPPDISGIADLTVSDDSLTITLRLRPTPTAPEGLASGCVTLLEKAGVPVDGEIRERVEKLVATYTGDTARAREAVVAQGAAAVDGEDGYLRFEEGMDPSKPVVRAKGEKAHAKGASAGANTEKVDHRNRSPYRMVRRCQRIGWVVPPKPGKDGRTALGEVIKAKVAEPASVKVEPTIEQRDDGELRAVVDGALQHDANGLRVLTHLEVRGAVDFSTGNIEFAGDLTVSEGVKDCFSVVVDGTLQVRGLVEAANLKTARDMHLHGGMAAREKGRLLVGRDLFARYLDNVDARVGRHLFIEKELNNCTVSVAGEFRCERAQVVGGRLCVAGPVEVQSLGGDSGVETVVVLGRFGEADGLLDGVDGMELMIRARTEEAEERLEELSKSGPRPTPSQTKETEALRSEVERLGARLGVLRGARERIDGLAAAHAKVDCTVRGTLHQGVRLEAGGTYARLRMDVAGPVHVGLGEDGGMVLTDLRSGDSMDLSGVAEVGRIRADEGAEQVSQAA